MPDKRQAQSNASSDNLDEAIWRLKVQGDNNHDGSTDVHPNLYPDRPGAPDCIYYLRTGMCGYGSNCKYNHPNPQGIENKDELPERVGQPDCQFFLKTGTCKFGASCKYHHPRDKLNAQPLLNVFGLPMREDEKSCPYYMRNGSCKFGIACKFNHPQPPTYGALFPVSGLPTYGSTGSSMVSPTGLPLLGGLPAWSLSRPHYVSSQHMPAVPAYMPVVLPPSQGALPMQSGWSTYTGAVNQISSREVVGQNQASSPEQHLELPDRPDQPDCQYFMRTGTCKYGASCKYHHPKDNSSPVSDCMFGPFGLPIRPDEPVCAFYSVYGSCKYGPACKYHHPVELLYNYALPAISMQDQSLRFSPQRNPQINWTSPEASTTTKTLKVSEKTNSDTGHEQEQQQQNSENGSTPEQASPSNTAPADSPRHAAN